MLRDSAICLSAIEQAADAMFIVDAGNEVIFQNAEARRMFGYSDEEIASHSIHEKIHHDYPDGSEVPLERCMVYRSVRYGETARDFTWLVSRKDGSQFHVLCSAAPLRMHGEIVGAVFCANDITLRKNAEMALKNLAEQFRLAVEVADVGLYDYYPESNELIWTEPMRRWFGLPPEAPVTVDTFFAGLHPDDRERVRKIFSDSQNPEYGGSFQFEYRVIGQVDGKERCLISKGQVFFEDDKPVRRIGAVVDITDRKLKEEAVRQASQHDPLTGLPNRALLEEYAAHLFAMAERDEADSAVLFIDLDRFKPINDLYGHDVGDKVLMEIGRRLRTVTRKEDIISRLGGDEFVVVLPHIDTTADPWTVAQHIQEAIEIPIQIDTVQASVSSSIGISLFPKHGKDLDTLIRRADLAMYNAKRSGRNTVQTYIPGHDEKASDLLQLEMHLKQALESDRMTLVYQPIVDVATGDLAGVEALLRMVGLNGDLLTPDKFIAIAESAGLIDKLDKWVTNEACKQYQWWRAAGLPPLTMSINVSSFEFRQHGFARHVAKAIEETGIDPACLQIEVTESTVMNNVAEAAGILNELRSMGVRIALDDFGTGYSSLSYLSNLPLDKLKIDQSFIRRIDTSESSRSITDTIIGLGRLMKLQVVGEGIESLQTMKYLKERGCDQAQGFLFSRPLPAHEFERWYWGQSRHMH